MGKWIRNAGLVALALVVVMLLTSKPGEGVAPVPGVFKESLTLSAAVERAKATQKPVLVYATADWCGPCQQFKRTTLVDPSIVEWIASRTEPVYLNIDRSRAEAASLSITSIPATILLRDGVPAARISGAVPPAEYLAWLQSEAPGQ